MRLVFAVIVYFAMPLMARPFVCATRIAAKVFPPGSNIVQVYANLLQEVGRESLSLDDLDGLRNSPFHLSHSNDHSKRALFQAALDTLVGVISARPDSHDEILAGIRDILDAESAFRREEERKAKTAARRVERNIGRVWSVPSPRELTGVRLAPNGKYVVAASHSGAWGIESPTGNMRYLDYRIGYTPHYSAITFSADSKSVFLSGAQHPLSEFETGKGWRLKQSLSPADIGVPMVGNYFPLSRANDVVLRNGDKGNPLIATVEGRGLRLFEKGKYKIISPKPFLRRWFAPAPYPEVTSSDALNVALSPDGKTVAYSAGSWGISLIDTVTGKRTRPLPIPPGNAEKMLFSPDGKHLVTVGSGILNIWNVAEKNLISTANTQGYLRAVTFLSNEIVVLVDQGDEKAHQYILKDGTYIGILDEVGDSLATIDISPANEYHDSPWAVVSRNNKTVELIELSGR